MKTVMRLARSRLSKILTRHELTAGMYVRVHGDHLIVGRRESVTHNNVLEEDDRVRLTHRNASTYGLSVKRHTGRWERTPFCGTMEEMVEVMFTFMQHLVAASPGCTGTFGARH